MNPPDFQSLASRFRRPGVVAVALMGSQARGDAGPFSDVDLVRFTARGTESVDAETCFIDGRFVVVSEVTPSDVEAWFTRPARATEFIAGLRTARSLWDPDGYFEAIQKRALRFVWDAAMQERANAYASAQMVGWIEEVQKGLEGLRRGDEGRMLNAKHGLTWGLTRVMRVQRGVLISGDNASYTEVVRSLGTDTEWVALSRKAFGLDHFPLPEQIRAGLRLYVLTYELLVDVLKPEDGALVKEAVERIRRELQRAHPTNGCT
jgi:hypothetical protein